MSFIRDPPTGDQSSRLDFSRVRCDALRLKAHVADWTRIHDVSQRDRFTRDRAQYPETHLRHARSATVDLAEPSLRARSRGAQFPSARSVLFGRRVVHNLRIFRVPSCKAFDGYRRLSRQQFGFS